MAKIHDLDICADCKKYELSTGKCKHTDKIVDIDMKVCEHFDPKYPWAKKLCIGMDCKHCEIVGLSYICMIDKQGVFSRGVSLNSEGELERRAAKRCLK